MLDRELLKRDPSAGRKLENTVPRNHQACPSPRSDPGGLAWRARRGQSRPSEAGIRGIPVESAVSTRSLEAAIVENKRLGAGPAFIPEQHVQRGLDMRTIL
jgi:hypothetical protein